MASESSAHPDPPPPYNPTLYPPTESQQKTEPVLESPSAVYVPQTQNPSAYVPAAQQAQQPALGQPSSATIVIGLPVYGTIPANVTCPNCRQSVITVIQHHPGLLTWLLVGGLALFGLGFGCCLIPLCVDGCQDVEHSCPNCKAFLGTYKRI